MKFALLIYSDEIAAPMPETPQAQRIFDEYFAFTTKLAERGISRGGEAFHDSGAATTVRVVDGEVILTEAPAVDSREALGGFYLIEVPDKAAAVAVAAELPGSRYGSVEVRPVWAWE
jgi:hypothetical protein